MNDATNANTRGCAVRIERSVWNLSTHGHLDNLDVGASPVRHGESKGQWFLLVCTFLHHKLGLKSGEAQECQALLRDRGALLCLIYVWIDDFVVISVFLRSVLMRGRQHQAGRAWRLLVAGGHCSHLFALGLDMSSESCLVK